MKKYIYILLPFIFWGCQKDFNNVVDSTPSSYQVSKVYGADSVMYDPSDSLMTISIGFYTSKDIQTVSANVIASDNTQLNTDPVILYDNGNFSENGDTVRGDNIYSNKFPLSHYYPKGIYQIQYFVTDISNQTKLAAVHTFVFDNGQGNVAPVISNLVAPDTETIQSVTINIFVSVFVHDDNGLNDIKSVFFNSYIPPDGHPSSQNPIIMYDDGTHGDVTAGDGIYSTYVELPSSGVPKGTFKWEFQAQDRGGLLSNKIIHYLVIK